MAVTIEASNHSAHQTRGGDTKTGPHAWRVTPHNLIDAPRQPGNDPHPTRDFKQQEAAERPSLPVNQIDATRQPD
jgi:hypothetical protein